MSLLSRQHPLSILPTMLYLLAILPPNAQAQERESLKEPVFRVVNDVRQTLTTNDADSPRDILAPLNVAAALDSATGSKTALTTAPLTVKPLKEQLLKEKALAEKPLNSTVGTELSAPPADHDELIGKVASNAPLAKIASPKLSSSAQAQPTRRPGFGRP